MSDLNVRKIMAERYKPVDVKVFERHARTLKGQDLLTFCKECAIHDPEVVLRLIYPTWKWEWFHRSWLKTIFDAAKAGEEEVLVLAPRDHGKSAYLTTGLAAWWMVQPEVNYLRAAVVSASKDKASDFMADLQTPLLDPGFNAIFGTFKSNKWGAFAFNVKGKARRARGNTMIACGRSSGQVVGKHFDFQLCDDIIDEDIAGSMAMRQKFHKWMANSFKPTLEPEGFRVFIGTRYAQQDYYGHMLKHDVRWNGKKTCSFYLDHSSKEIMWPWKFKEGFLEKKIKEDGIANVSLQYFNDPERYSGDIFRKEWFRYTSEKYKDGEIVFGVDVAYLHKDLADYTAVCVLRKRPTGELIVENVVQGKWSQDECVNMILHLMERYPARHIVIEDPRVIVSGKANNLYLYQSLRKLNLPVKMMRPEQKDKGLRWIDNLQHLYENGIIIHREGLSKFEGQLLGAGAGALDHDDLIDSLDIAVSMFRRKKKVYSKGSIGN